MKEKAARKLKKSNKKQSSVLVEWKLISVGEDDSFATGKNANNGGKNCHWFGTLVGATEHNMDLFNFMVIPMS